VLPISYGDARPLLEALGGPVAPADWRGALPITYHVGPGPAKARLKLAFDWKVVPVRDVIATIPGSVWPDEWVLHGNHHDAWVNGSEDPISGMAPLLEEARAYGELLRKGWRPKRTIVLCAWDGEEEGLFGSTEWVETHAEELARKAVVYVNSDSNARGFLFAGGSPTLEGLVEDASGSVADPEKKIPVGKRRRLKQIADASKPEDRKELRERAHLRIDPLGSGSDWTPFLQHVGIASLNLGFGGETDGGVYHSIYDDFAWYTRFADPDFIYGRALAQTIGTVVMRVADADLLPFDPSGLAEASARWLKEVRELAEEKRQAAEELSREVAEGLPDAVADPREPFVPPSKEGPVPFFDFSPLENAQRRLTAAADEYRNAREAAGDALHASRERVARVNAVLRTIERGLTLEKGLPRRPWYRHYLYSPGFYTGYDVKTLPAVREAIEQKQWAEVNPAISATADALDRAAATIEQAAKALK